MRSEHAPRPLCGEQFLCRPSVLGILYTYWRACLCTMYTNVLYPLALFFLDRFLFSEEMFGASIYFLQRQRSLHDSGDVIRSLRRQQRLGTLGCWN